MSWMGRIVCAALAALAWTIRDCKNPEIADRFRQVWPDPPAPDGWQTHRMDLLNDTSQAMAQGETSSYWGILRDFSLEEPEEIALGLAACLARYPILRDVFRHFWGADAVTLEAAEAVYSACVPGQRMDFSRRELAFERLSALFCPEPSGQFFFRVPLPMDERVYGCLEGSYSMDRRLLRFCTFQPWDREPPPLFAGWEQLEELAGLLGYSQPILPAAIQLAGPSGCGKRLLLRHAAHRLEQDFIFADCAEFGRMKPAEQADALRWLRREQLLTGVGICWYHLSEAAVLFPALFPLPFLTSVRPLMGGGLPVCFCSGAEVEVLPHLDAYAARIAVPEHTLPERIALWEGYGEAYSLENGLNREEAASKFRLSGREIEKAVRRLAALQQAGEPLSLSVVERVCREVIALPSRGGLQPVDTTSRLEDLVLPPEQKQTLLDICAHVWHRHRVYDRWELRRRYPYGRSVSALFVGPPGTGKTMAAHVLSGMLGLPLYQVNLSQVVDKYIGETEKRLEEIFRCAEKCSPILFFDEADSIFGKRSEVQDARDRYANTEVSYILQRMEQYDGVVVLASNFKKNIDEAFMRRIRYYVEFNLPDAELREQIWRGCFTKEVPQEGLDFPYLARQFELAGGSIKNIVLNAVFLAAAEGCPVGMRQMIRSIRQENLKIGKALFREDFAEYGYLL